MCGISKHVKLLRGNCKIQVSISLYSSSYNIGGLTIDFVLELPIIQWVTDPMFVVVGRFSKVTHFVTCN